MQKENKKEGNGFIVKSEKGVSRRLTTKPNAFHNEIALGIISADEKLKGKYAKSPFKGQPAVFLVQETPAIMVASGLGTKVISYNPKNIQGDHCLEKEVKKYKKKGFMELNISF